MTQPHRKVLYLITKSNWGGAQRYVYDLATHAPPGWEPIVVFGGTGIPGSDAGQLASALADAGIRTLHLHSLGRDVGVTDIKAFLGILRVLRAERPDVLHLNSSKAAGLGALAGRIARVPRIIYTAHGWPFWEERSLMVRGIIFALSWLTVLLAHLTICISDFDRTQLARAPFMRRRLITIRNGVTPLEYLERSVARAALFDSAISAAHARDVWVVTVAELHPNKNIMRAIDAVKRYNAAHDRKIFYVICGSGELRDALSKQADASVFLRGFVADAARYLKAFDVFLLSSLKEGVPYALLEAARAGLPAVVSNVGGIPETVSGAANAYLVDPKKVDDIVRALTVAVVNLSESVHGPTLEDVVAERFSQALMLSQTFALYELHSGARSAGRTLIATHSGEHSERKKLNNEM